MKNMNRTIRSVLVCSFVIVSAHGMGSAQFAVTPRQAREYLRHPNGLERLAELQGDVSFTDEEEVWGNHTLESLVTQSDLIVCGIVSGKVGALTSDGDDVSTEYILTAPTSLKGTLPSEVHFVNRGGTVQLRSGHSATIHTIATDAIEVSGRYVFFLQKVGNVYTLAGDSQRLFIVDPVNGSLRLADAIRDRNIALASSVSRLRSHDLPAALGAYIQTR